MRSLRVLLVGDHALAVDAAGDALQAITGVDVVARTSWAAAGTRPNGEVDVVVLEQSLAEPVTPELPRPTRAHASCRSRCGMEPPTGGCASGRPARGSRSRRPGRGGCSARSWGCTGS
jgi:hypothetical protein